MNEALIEAKEELKRSDHLIFVSLKYTRTVDVIRNVIQRLVSTYDQSVQALIEYGLEKEKFSEDDVPLAPVKKIEFVRKYFSDFKKMNLNLDFYLYLRKLNRVKEWKALREYRRHVTMETAVDGEPTDVNMDLVGAYYETTKEFVLYVQHIVTEDYESLGMEDQIPAS